MRILIAPDDFKGTLSAAEAASAIAEGWARTQPRAEFDLRPISDGGHGFVEALAVARAVPVLHAEVEDSFGRATSAAWCRDEGTAYLEAAQVVGLQFGTDVLHASSQGVGGLLEAAVAAGCRNVVLGLGGTNVNDGGAGLLGALGATAVDAQGRAVPLGLGPLPLGAAARVDLSAAQQRLAGISLRIATDVDVPLLGPRGATYGFAPQKGGLDADLLRMESALAAFARACGRRPDGKDAAVALGSGAAGGLGFALLRLGADRVPGIEFVLDASNLDVSAADLVITGEGSLDWQSMRGKAISGVAQRALRHGVPVIAIAGRVEITARERSEMGLDAAYSVTEFAGETTSMEAPAAALAATAARVARTWG